MGSEEDHSSLIPSLPEPRRGFFLASQPLKIAKVMARVVTIFTHGEFRRFLIAVQIGGHHVDISPSACAAFDVVSLVVALGGGSFSDGLVRKTVEVVLPLDGAA